MSEQSKYFMGINPNIHSGQAAVEALYSAERPTHVDNGRVSDSLSISNMTESQRLASLAVISTFHDHPEVFDPASTEAIRTFIHKVAKPAVQDTVES